MVVMVVVSASAGVAEIPLGNMGDRLRPTEQLGKDGDLFPPSVRPSVMDTLGGNSVGRLPRESPLNSNRRIVPPASTRRRSRSRSMAFSS